ncbi:MAG: zinc-ribbon domain-containing protein [Anaerolineaceae bacterium]|nr:MAG: zinc-ribbon domain-containing protein [Anaerolineaceae bacterium]
MYKEVKVMVCNSCGRSNQNESANFCEYCGASFREGNLHESETTYNYSYQSGIGNASAQIHPPMQAQAIDISKNEKPVSFLNWLGTYAIMFIPFVGGIVLFVMLIVWSFGGNVAESKKNWARATLVFMIVMFIIVMIFVLMFIMMLKDPVFQDIFNQEMNQYNDIFKDFSY